jgi:hypothetical protein
MKYYAIKLAETTKTGDKFQVTRDLVNTAPHFDTEEEAANYTQLISPDALWVIGPVKEDEVLRDISADSK